MRSGRSRRDTGISGERVDAMWKKNLVKKIWMAAATISIATLPSDCQTTFKDTLTASVRGTVATVLDPGNFDFTGLIRELLGIEN